ncbi:MAG: type II toxin-antitoxin system VapC family toxin [Dehalococcoidia bacterium]|nr:type II toxin-antitoxin system VapC family toxin [Dehalococcoidia bacterium]
MQLLLDTHALIWWLIGSARLRTGVRHAIADETNDKLISAASAWEITTKHRAGRLPEADEFVSNIREAIAGEGFEELSITVDDAARAGALPGPLRDPFDRMLIAQAQSRNLVFISNEPLFDRYGVRRLW